ncbi:LLM class flavin-dependent oxidoreductase [Nocardia jejuensis]|uniref:LLM class flavin-dependent oxidoreductase n=1 Tax=Nocardia jejuensis TaxID=328049 RepID=UPI001FDFC91D|nr:LLM class flavin-dependent oxidoreductase [Nocardia jejuensis]
MTARRFALSILDLAPIARGRTARESFGNSVALAQAAERAGYQRIWYAEHHNIGTIASSATSVLIGHIAARTQTIRVGAGGIMLPHHAPLVIAEQFGTLETLFPGRIDLGLGRATGANSKAVQALRRNVSAVDSFPQDVLEVQGYLTGRSRVPGVQSIPLAEGVVPLYILGTSLFGAQLAAHLGLPYAFAAHFAPDLVHEAVAVYRDRFQPSEQLSEPYVLASVNVFAARTREQAQAQKVVAYRAQTRMLIRRGPQDDALPDSEIDAFLASPGGAQIAGMMSCTAVGTDVEVAAYLDDFADSIAADELVTVHHATEIADRVRSVELTGATIPAGR